MAKKKRKHKKRRKRSSSFGGSVDSVLKMQRDYVKLTAGLTFGYSAMGTLQKIAS